jgi:hypothetical protein
VTEPEKNVIVPIRPLIVDAQGKDVHKPKKLAPRWHKDMKNKSRHTINGHWFEVSTKRMGTDFIVVTYVGPAGKHRNGKKKNERKKRG